MDKNKEKAIEYFYKKKFNLAQFYFSLALENKENNIKELQFLSLLASLAQEKENEAYAILRIYEQSENKESFLNFSVIDEFFNEQDYIAKETIKKIDIDNSVSFYDFLNIVNKNGNFKESFENIVLSSKLVITKKNDFISFLNLLIENGYSNMSYMYLEKALTLFPNDKYFRKLLKTINKKEK